MVYSLKKIKENFCVYINKVFVLQFCVAWRQFIDCIIRAHYLWKRFLQTSYFGALSAEVNISHSKSRRVIDSAKFTL